MADIWSQYGYYPAPTPPKTSTPTTSTVPSSIGSYVMPTSGGDVTPYNDALTQAAATGLPVDPTPGAPDPFAPVAAPPSKGPFATWLAGDLPYGAAQKTFGSAQQSAHNNLRDLIRSKLIAAGINLNPSAVQSELAGYGDAVDREVGSALGEALDPATLATAATNPGSAMAGLSNALAAGKQDLRNALAARGLLGTAPFGAGTYTDSAGTVRNGFEDVLKNNYDVGSQNLLANVLGDIRTGIAGTGGYVPSLLGAQTNLDQALAEAQSRYNALPV